ncbi:hypothetical protein QQS21_009693 [Conoideocrella luteorostrata]|uniref:Uncharacterized protein n=1 Tax=Conoideocrella luteorostrata TaxID=1105319 RepID=A0AAJ0CGG9_9HYPO|nr:hypothetical protein QQS21_009693 [Conoideocrella luteorostrata]
MQFAHSLTFLCLVVFATGFALPGAYERLYFYYAYRLEQLTGGKTIAPGCSKASPCSLKDFIQYIQTDQKTVLLKTTEDLPNIEETAKKIVDAGLTGEIAVNRVVTGISDFSVLLKKVAGIVEGKMKASLHTNNKANEAERKKAQSDLDDIKTKIPEAVKGIVNARLESALLEFRPYKGFRIVPTKEGNGLDVKETVAANKGSTSEEHLESLWKKYIGRKKPTEKLLRDFRPFQDFKVKTTGSGRDMTLNIEDTLKASPGMDKEWLSNQWNMHHDHGHERNIKVLEDHLEELCGDGSRKRQDSVCNPKSDQDVPKDQDEKGKELPAPRPEQIDVAKTAEQVSEIEFSNFAEAYGLKVLPKEWKVKFPEVRTKLLGYKPLEPSSPKLNAGSGGVAGGKFIGTIGPVLWVGGVVQAFATNASALDRAAAITAIIPLVGCAVGDAAKDGSGNAIMNNLDTALCFLGDGLLLSGFLPASIIVGLLRTIIQTFTPPPKLPSKEEMQSSRDKAWMGFLNENLYTYIYSHEELYPRGTNNSYAYKLESVLKIEALAVSSYSAMTIGALNASSRIVTPNLDQKQLQTSTENATKIIRNNTLTEIAKRQRKFLLSLPLNLRDNFTSPIKDKYNTEFITKITSEEMIIKYQGPEPLNDEHYAYAVGTQNKAEANRIRRAPTRKHMDEIGEFLRKTPLPVPNLYEVSFILGQSKGLTVTHRTLSAQDYIKQKDSTISDDVANTIAIKHTISVVHLLQGKIKENQLADIYPALDDKSRRELNILLSMRMGQAYEEAKVADADRRRGQYLPLTELHKLIRPIVPPVPTHPNNTILVGLLIGLSNAVVETKLNESNLELLTKNSQDAMNKFKQFILQIYNPEFKSSLLDLQFKSDHLSKDLKSSGEMPRPLSDKPHARGWRRRDNTPTEK